MACCIMRQAFFWGEIGWLSDGLFSESIFTSNMNKAAKATVICYKRLQ